MFIDSPEGPKKQCAQMLSCPQVDFDDASTSSTEDYSETSAGSMDEDTESSCLCLVSESQIESLTLDISKQISECMQRKNKLQADLRKCLEKTKARYACGGQGSALGSMRRVQKLRNEITQLTSMRCVLLELRVQLQMEIQRFETFQENEPVMVDLELEEFRAALETVLEQARTTKLPDKDDDELLRELVELGHK